MIRWVDGNLFESDCEAWCITVNCVGVMGKGIALTAKQKFPALFAKYKAHCDYNILYPGAAFPEENTESKQPKEFVLCATKDHWRYPSSYEWVFESLKNLREVIQMRQYKSIAVPPLGCGNGKLLWSEVSCMITNWLSDLEGVRVDVYRPT